ncbi:MAG: hypothetical protein HPY50_11785 [Firmicutes bacterium]|nr:hypothetical protein [Bacillota bacterium]
MKEAGELSNLIEGVGKKDKRYLGEQRCVCNRLICIVNCVIQDDIIEIKCAKCKRIIRISTHGIKRIDYL